MNAVKTSMRVCASPFMMPSATHIPVSIYYLDISLGDYHYRILLKLTIGQLKGGGADGSIILFSGTELNYAGE